MAVHADEDRRYSWVAGVTSGGMHHLREFLSNAAGTISLDDMQLSVE
jgi:hypothetical protein